MYPSTSSGEGLEAISEMCSAIREERSDLLIIVGGGAIRDNEHAVALGAGAWAASSQQMSELIEAHLVRSHSQTVEERQSPG